MGMYTLYREGDVYLCIVISPVYMAVGYRWLCILFIGKESIKYTVCSMRSEYIILGIDMADWQYYSMYRDGGVTGPDFRLKIDM